MKKKILSILLMAAMLLSVQGISVMAGSVTGGNEAESTGAASPVNPVHHCTKENDGSDYTDWSYVYFGSYPQTEVTGDELTLAITGTAYDANGDAWVNGTKYRRISKSDTNNDHYFGDGEYRYFKWERIKWRVLKVNGSTMFVAADKGLDCKNYHDPGGSVTWETCTLRNWLNNDFYGTAFSSGEQGAVVSQTVVSEDNPYYNTEGGNDTTDKVYLLSLSEVVNPEYGFCESYSTYSVSRRVKASDYAHARGADMETDSDYAGHCWWLRSPGYYTNFAASVYSDGGVGRLGCGVDAINVAVAPALQINLSSDLWTTTDDGTSGTGGGSGTGGTGRNNTGSGTGGTGGNQSTQYTTIEQGNATYTITDTAKKTVEYIASTNKSQKTVTIPASIKINNTAYTVTSIAAQAFKGNKTLTKVTIGKNIKTIGKQAFFYCTKLKKVTIKTTGLTAKTVGAKAFKGIAKKAAIKVPAKKLSAYQKLLKKKGITGKAQKIKK